jgi:hypothetical protein
VLFDKAMIELSSLVASVTLEGGQLSAASLLNYYAYIKEFGFFFFFRIAVEVSSSSFFSAPEASLHRYQYLEHARWIRAPT